jgi:hypothetical protein
MKSGMLAAETVGARRCRQATQGRSDLVAYEEAFKDSWLYAELSPGTQFRAGAAQVRHLPGWRIQLDPAEPVRRAHVLHAQGQDQRPRATAPAASYQPIEYARPDGQLTFDRLSSVFMSNTAHEEEQPVHLQLLDSSKAIAINFKEYASPEQRYCPAGVYEIVEEASRPAPADQRVELPALQDLRHQGPDAEHPLGRSRGWRRAELSQYVSDVIRLVAGGCLPRSPAAAPLVSRRCRGWWGAAPSAHVLAQQRPMGHPGARASAAMIAGDAGALPRATAILRSQRW